MNENHLIKISLTTTLLGIILLYLLLINITYETNLPIPDSTIKLKGKIKSISSKKSYTKLQLEHIIDITVFKNTKFKIGEEIEIVGKIEKYKGKPQMNAIYIVSSER